MSSLLPRRIWRTCCTLGRSAMRAIASGSSCHSRPQESRRAASFTTAVTVVSLRGFGGLLAAFGLPAVRAALGAGARFGARTPLAQLIDADVAFHSAIHVLSGNRAIVETVADQWPHFRRSMGLVLSVSGAQARYWDEHASILEAILAGDAPAAEERARRHTAAAGEATARQLEAEQQASTDA